MKTYQFTPDITLVDLAIPIIGAEGMLGSYVIKASRIAVMDVGPSNSQETLLAALKSLDISPQQVEYVLCTHIHLDHSGGLGKALQILSRAKAIVNERGVRHLVDPTRLWQGSLEVQGNIAIAYGQPLPVPEDRLIPVTDTLAIDLGNLRLEAIATPGHAPHHLSFFDRQRRKLFPGEAAGVYFPDTGISRPASPPPFDMRRTLASLDRLIALNPKELYYSHFGYSPEAMTRLKINRGQVISWGRLIAEHRDEPPESIADLVITQDGTRDMIYGFPPDRQNTELYFVRNNVRGYQDYFKREGMGILRELEAEH